MKSKFKWDLLIFIVALWLLGSVGLIMQIRQTIPPAQQTLEIVKTALLLLGGLGVILPTYLNIWQSVETNQAMRDKIAFDINENTYRIIQAWDDPALLAARGLCRDINQKRKDYSDTDIVNKINGDTRLTESVILIFNYWENVRVSIVMSRVNVETLRASVSPMFAELYKTFKPWIETRRPGYLHDLEWLNKKWQP